MEANDQWAFFLINQANPLAFIISKHLTDQQGRIDSILIPHKSSGQIAITFLKAKDIPVFFSLLFQKADLLTDKLKSGENIDYLHTIVFRNLAAGILPDARFGLWCFADFTAQSQRQM